jgi:small multidrug resistance pump
LDPAFAGLLLASSSYDGYHPRWKTGTQPGIEKSRMKNHLAIAVTIGFSVVGVLGDYLLKLASAHKEPLRSPWFYVGFAVYASTAFGWVFVMRHLKLATISVVYSVSMILLLTGIGSLVFREPLNDYEVVGLLMAIGALILLMRFA